MTAYGRSRARARARGAAVTIQTVVSATLSSVDFTALTPGDVASLPGGYVLTRAAGADTVQTGTSTIVSAITTGHARAGRALDTDPVGLVLEDAATNLLLQSRALGNAAWSGAGVTTIAQTSPDGTTSGTQVVSLSGGTGRYQSTTITGGARYVGSAWSKPSAASQIVVGSSSTAGVSIPNTGVYGRYQISQIDGAIASKGLYLADGRGGLGAAVAGSRNEVLDFAQMEAGWFATEAIPTTTASATRAADRLQQPSASALVGGGAITIAVTLQPKGASGQYPGNMRIWTDAAAPAQNFVEVDASTSAVRVTVGGVAYVTPVAMSWAQGDVLDIFAAVGGTVACKVEYRVNGGAATVLSTGSPTAFGALAPAGALDVLCNGAASVFTARVRKIAFYQQGKTPAWVV